MEHIDIYALHDLLFEARHIEEFVTTSQVDCETSKDYVQNGETNQK